MPQLQVYCAIQIAHTSRRLSSAQKPRPSAGADPLPLLPLPADMTPASRPLLLAASPLPELEPGCVLLLATSAIPTACTAAGKAAGTASTAADTAAAAGAAVTPDDEDEANALPPPMRPEVQASAPDEVCPAATCPLPLTPLSHCCTLFFTLIVSHMGSHASARLENSQKMGLQQPKLLMIRGPSPKLAAVPTYAAAVTTPTAADWCVQGTLRASSEWMAGKATPSPMPSRTLRPGSKRGTQKVG